MAEFSTFEKTGLFPIDKKRCISDKDQKIAPYLEGSRPSIFFQDRSRGSRLSSKR
jgi:hypothetical protein